MLSGKYSEADTARRCTGVEVESSMKRKYLSKCTELLAYLVTLSFRGALIQTEFLGLALFHIFLIINHFFDRTITNNALVRLSVFDFPTH